MKETMMKTSVESEPSFDMEEDDLIMLESLIKSPAFGAFKRLVNKYRGGTQTLLMNAKEMQTLFQAQGHIIGLNLVESLPGIVVRAREMKLLKAEEAAKQARPTYRPEFPIFQEPSKKPKS